MNRFSIKIVGPAGFGIKITGQILAKYFLRQGFSVFAYTEYPSLIRGGHNTYQVDLACQIHPERGARRRVEGPRGIEDNTGVRSPSEKCDILIAFTGEALNKEFNNLNSEAVIICDEKIILDSRFRSPRFRFGEAGGNDKVVLAPLVEIAKEVGDELMKNTVALGVLFGILDLPLEKLNEILGETFGRKSDISEKNIQAAKCGHEWGRNHKNMKTPALTRVKRGRLKHENKIFLLNALRSPKSIKGKGKVLITGNQACALGIIAAQCQVYVAYPMTPASEILHYLEAKQREVGMVVHQPEDEIAGILAALGASFAGARAATGTSGGGFALMNEGLSLAGMLELPLVIFEVMRPAPATGNPTWTEQGDLLYVINAGHGEFPKIVLTPGNSEECFLLTQKAFNLADKYQVPVIILSDKFLGESAYTVEKNVFDKIEKVENGKLITENTKTQKTQKTPELFMRYKLENDGVSWRTIPGIEGGEHIANSDEHNEFSYSDDSRENRIKMMDKRLRKLEEIRKEMPLPEVYGPKDAEVTLVTWGSQWGPTVDVMEMLNNKSKIQNPKFETNSIPHQVLVGDKIQSSKKLIVNVLHFNHVWPLPSGLDKFLSKFKKLVLVENNKTAQLGQLIRQETGIEIKDKILKYDSRPFWCDELVKKIKTF